MVHGLYFDKCPCGQLMNPIILEYVGCVCRLLFFGAKGPRNSALRFFKGSRNMSTDWQ
jgi:hypothetical protein